MYCYKCGEDNPDEAKFCRNCGAPLKREEEVKKVEVIDSPNYNQNQQQRTTTTTTSTSSGNSDSSAWIGCCCLGLIVVFILSALFSGI